ncbi:MAG: hypothetical protein A2136_05570 [Chloroflexi bacterium RBG_16_54_11]|nr:MAG: hypothetical protein A2136_05570 [Chloroflexi bacterium RBG_16_54_11]
MSEQIARAYVSHHEIIEYNAPILTREEHEAQMDRAREVISNLRDQVDRLKRGLPVGDKMEDPEEYENDDEDYDDQEDDL